MRTLAEIAAELGMTPQGVHYHEAKALAKIRKELLKRRIVTKEGRYAN